MNDSMWSAGEAAEAAVEKAADRSSFGHWYIEEAIGFFPESFQQLSFRRRLESIYSISSKGF